MTHVNLPELIDYRRQHGAGSFRAMAQRATDAGEPISHVQISEYAKGPRPVPSEATRRALAAALGVSVPAVTRAAVLSVAPDMSEGVASEHAQAFVRRVEGRTEDDIQLLLGVLDATLRAMDGPRKSVERNADGPDVPDRS